MTSFVGVDLHRNNFTYCIRENGEEKKIGKCEISELKGFASLLGKDTAMAVEATGNTFMFCRFLKAHVGRLVVVNPSQFKVISTSTKKTDKHDAKILAEFLEKDMLLSFHFDPITDTELFVVVEQIRSLNQSIEKLDKAIEDHGSKMDGFKNLKSIKGIGSKGAATLLSTIGNIHDFRSSKQLAAYIGIVPRVSNSNDTVCHGRITKNGSKIARTTLVQCALIAKRYSPYLHAFHESVKSRRGGAKANIALARKFLDIVYRTLKNNWMFEDFTQFKLVKN